MIDQTTDPIPPDDGLVVWYTPLEHGASVTLRAGLLVSTEKAQWLLEKALEGIETLPPDEEDEEDDLPGLNHIAGECPGGGNCICDLTDDSGRPVAVTEVAGDGEATDRLDGYDPTQRLARKLDAWLNQMVLDGALSASERAAVHLAVGPGTWTWAEGESSLEA